MHVTGEQGLFKVYAHKLAHKARLTQENKVKSHKLSNYSHVWRPVEIYCDYLQ